MSRALDRSAGDDSDDAEDSEAGAERPAVLDRDWSFGDAAAIAAALWAGFTLLVAVLATSAFAGRPAQIVGGLAIWGVLCSGPVGALALRELRGGGSDE